MTINLFVSHISGKKIDQLAFNHPDDIGGISSIIRDVHDTHIQDGGRPPT